MRNGDSDTATSALATPKISSLPPRARLAKAASIAAGTPVASTATPNAARSASVTSPATLAAPTALATSRRAALRLTTVTDRAPARFSS